MSKAFHLFVLMLILSPGYFWSCTSNQKAPVPKESELTLEEQELLRMVPWQAAVKLIPMPNSWGARYSADGRKIRFASSEGAQSGQAEIYEMDVATKAIVRMTYQSGFADEPRFVPTTGALLYSSNVDELKERPILFEAYSSAPNEKIHLPELKPLAGNELYYREDREAVPKRLTRSAGFDGFVSIHPDGNRFAYSTSTKGNLDIYHGELSGSSAVKAMISGPAMSAFPIYSPKGEQILWIDIHSEPLKSVFFIASSKGENPMELQSFEGVASSPHWHPKEDILVFSGKKAQQKTFGIYGLNLAGRCVTELFRSEADLEHPAFSHDGSQLLLTVSLPKGKEVFQLPFAPADVQCPNTTTTPAAEVTTDSDAVAPTAD